MSGVTLGLCAWCDKKGMVFIDPFGTGGNWCHICLVVRAAPESIAFESNGHNPEETKLKIYDWLRSVEGAINFEGNAFERTASIIRVVEQLWESGTAARKRCAASTIADDPSIEDIFSSLPPLILSKRK